MGDLVPLYPLYVLLFADSGLSLTQISVLFALWSGCAIALELPFGALSDLVSRRTVLLAASLMRAVAIGLWLVAPSFAGFAVGFGIWAASESLVSGTWEALTYEHLSALGLTGRYAAAVGRASAAQWIAIGLAAVCAGPLFAIGGYDLVIGVSVATALTQAVVALSLPRGAPHADSSATLLTTLRIGVDAALTNRSVRLPLLAVALLAGAADIDEYLPLLLRAADVSQVVTPLLLGALPLTAAVGGWAAGNWSDLPPRSMGVVLVVASIVTVVVAALWPLGGFGAFAVLYGLVEFARVVADVRLQHAVAGPARATVTSMAGLGGEIVAVVLFLAVAGVGR